MSDYISLWKSRQIIETERKISRSSIVYGGFDCIALINWLHTKQVLDKSQKIKLFYRYSLDVAHSNENQLRHLLGDIKQEVGFSKYETALKGICEFLKNLGHSVNVVVINVRPERVEAENHDKKLLRFFTEIKSEMDNNEENRSLVCDTLSRQLIQTAMAATAAERQTYFDQFAIVKMQSIQLLKKAGLRGRFQVLDEMYQQMPEDIDKTFAHQIILSKKATSYANAGDTEKAEAFIEAALQKSLSCPSPFQRMIICYDAVYVYRTLKAKTGNARFTDKIAEVCKMGLDSLDNHSAEQSEMCRRLLLLHLAQEYLGISIDLTIDQTVAVPCRGKFDASQILKQYLTGLGNMERRREMFYHLCKARIHENEDAEMAFFSCNRALLLAADGAYYPEDKSKIEEYRQHLYTKATPLPELQDN